jgi:hypothetical protein
MSGKPIFIATAAALAILSVCVVGVQLIGASSDAAYALQMAMICIAAMIVLSKGKNVDTSALIHAVTYGVAASALPVETLLEVLTGGVRSSSSGAWSHSNSIVQYVAGTVGLFLVHSAVMYAAISCLRKTKVVSHSE